STLFPYTTSSDLRKPRTSLPFERSWSMPSMRRHDDSTSTSGLSHHRWIHSSCCCCSKTSARRLKRTRSSVSYELNFHGPCGLPPSRFHLAKFSECRFLDGRQRMIKGRLVRGREELSPALLKTTDLCVRLSANPISYRHPSRHGPGKATNGRRTPLWQSPKAQDCLC